MQPNHTQHNRKSHPQRQPQQTNNTPSQHTTAHTRSTIPQQRPTQPHTTHTHSLNQKPTPPHTTRHRPNQQTSIPQATTQIHSHRPSTHQARTQTLPQTITKLNQPNIPQIHMLAKQSTSQSQPPIIPHRSQPSITPTTQISQDRHHSQSTQRPTPQPSQNTTHITASKHRHEPHHFDDTSAINS